MPSSSKYEPLGSYLRSRPSSELPMTFAEVEGILGFPLPPSARSHATWWSNNTGTHVGVRAWRDAGWRTSRVDVSGERVTFVRDETVAGVSEASAPFDGALLPLPMLSRSALAMIDDLAQETGRNRGEAIAAILEASAAERRRRMLESLPVASMPAGHDSSVLIREDRDAR